MSCTAGCCYDELNRFVGLIQSMNGRDKLSKTLQFITKLAALELMVGKADLAKRFASLSSEISMARKCDRLFKTLAEVKKVIETLSQGKDTTTQTLTILSTVGFGMYWFYDNKVFLTKAKFMPTWNAAQDNLAGSRWWLMGVIFQIALIWISLQKANRQSRSPNDSLKASGEKAVLENRIQLLAAVTDLICAVDAAEVFKFSEKTVTISGLASAFCGLYLALPAK